MSRQFAKAISYLRQVAKLPVRRARVLLPDMAFFLRDLYAFQILEIVGSNIVGIFVKDPENFRPSTFTKHIGQAPISNYDFVLVFERMPRGLRSRLIERDLPFIVPGKQLFWPRLGMEVRTRNDAVPRATADRVGPITQALAIAILDGRIRDESTSSVIANRFNWSPMSVKRALDDLENLSLITTKRQGRERLFRMPEDLEALWHGVKPRLRDPVRHRRYLNESDLSEELRILAGESALAERTMLAAPEFPTYALGRDAWALFEENETTLLPFPESGSCTIEIWRYEPSLLARDGQVDDFSLFLSLEASPDERIQAALADMMENREWSGVLRNSGYGLNHTPTGMS